VGRIPLRCLIQYHGPSRINSRVRSSSSGSWSARSGNLQGWRRTSSEGAGSIFPIFLPSGNRKQQFDPPALRFLFSWQSKASCPSLCLYVMSFRALTILVLFAWMPSSLPTSYEGVVVPKQDTVQVFPLCDFSSSSSSSYLHNLRLQVFHLSIIVFIIS